MQIGDIWWRTLCPDCGAHILWEENQTEHPGCVHCPPEIRHRLTRQPGEGDKIAVQVM